MDTSADWDKAAEILHGGGLRGDNFDPFILYSFTPSLKAYSHKVGSVSVSVGVVGVCLWVWWVGCMCIPVRYVCLGLIVYISLSVGVVGGCTSECGCSWGVYL